MADVLVPAPTKRRRVLVDKKCSCKSWVRFYRDEPGLWTEYGTTYGRCPGCSEILTLGDLGLKDTY